MDPVGYSTDSNDNLDYLPQFWGVVALLKYFFESNREIVSPMCVEATFN